MESMFISQGDAAVTPAIDYYESAILDGLSGAVSFTQSDWDALRLEITNSTELFDDEKTYLLGIFPGSQASLVSSVPEYNYSRFKYWYIKHIVVISIVQWLLIMILIIKLSKSR